MHNIKLLKFVQSKYLIKSPFHESVEEIYCFTQNIQTPMTFPHNLKIILSTIVSLIRTFGEHKQLYIYVYSHCSYIILNKCIVIHLFVFVVFGRLYKQRFFC